MPQSEFELHVPSGEFAHLPLRHDAPPQSEFELHVPPWAVAHTPLRQLTPGPQSELELQPPPPAEHLPLRHEPVPQSELELHVPSGALAHLPLRQDAPPQSELELHDAPAEVAHLPLRQLTPEPQSELELQEPPAAHAVESAKPETMTVVRSQRTRLLIMESLSRRCAPGTWVGESNDMGRWVEHCGMRMQPCLLRRAMSTHVGWESTQWCVRADFRDCAGDRALAW